MDPLKTFQNRFSFWTTSSTPLSTRHIESRNDDMTTSRLCTIEEKTLSRDTSIESRECNDAESCGNYREKNLLQVGQMESIEVTHLGVVKNEKQSSSDNEQKSVEKSSKKKCQEDIPNTIVLKQLKKKKSKRKNKADKSIQSDSSTPSDDISSIPTTKGGVSVSTYALSTKSSIESTLRKIVKQKILEKLQEDELYKNCSQSISSSTITAHAQSRVYKKCPTSSSSTGIFHNDKQPFYERLHNYSTASQKSAQKGRKDIKEAKKKELSKQKIATTVNQTMKSKSKHSPKKDLLPKKKSRDLLRAFDDDEIFNRLYAKSAKLQEEGKIRRNAIEEAIARAHFIPDFSEWKIPLSQAENFYYRNVEYQHDLEMRLEAARITGRPVERSKLMFATEFSPDFEKKRPLHQSWSPLPQSNYRKRSKSTPRQRIQPESCYSSNFKSPKMTSKSSDVRTASMSLRVTPNDTQRVLNPSTLKVVHDSTHDTWSESHVSTMDDSCMNSIMYLKERGRDVEALKRIAQVDSIITDDLRAKGEELILTFEKSEEEKEISSDEECYSIMDKLEYDRMQRMAEIGMGKTEYDLCRMAVKRRVHSILTERGLLA